MALQKNQLVVSRILTKRSRRRVAPLLSPRRLGIYCQISNRYLYRRHYAETLHRSMIHIENSAFAMSRLPGRMGTLNLASSPGGPPSEGLSPNRALPHVEVNSGSR